MGLEKYIEAVANINLFKDFGKKQLTKLLEENKYHIKEYRKGDVIHFQNEICNTMDIVLVGKVLVQKLDENGNILTISTFSSSEVMGANLIFSSRNYYPMTIIAKLNSIILHIPKELILKLCKDNLNFLVSLITVISDKTITLTDTINSITLKTIRQCIIDFLIYEYYVQKNAVIKLSMSKKEMAEKFGVQRPSLSRELNKMRKDGLIEYDANSITIKDLTILKR